MRTRVVAVAAILATVAVPVMTSCGTAGKPDRMEQVSQRCKDEVKKKLRDPDSARFGDTEYIVEQKLSSADTSFPPSEKRYEVIGLVSGRNGFGGMGEQQTYTCYVAFDTNGKIIEDGRTRSSYIDDAKFLNDYIREAQESGTNPPVTRSVNPDGTSRK